MFLVNKTSDLVVVSSDTIKETKDFFIADDMHYVKIDLKLIKETLPAEFEVGKTTYTSEAAFTKIGDVDNGITMGDETEEVEAEEEVNTDTEASEGN